MSKSVLDRLVSLFGTSSGTDTTLMVIQWTSRLIASYLSRNLTEIDPQSLPARLKSLVSFLADMRTAGRYYHLIPMIQWAGYIEKHPHELHKIQNLRRIENIMLFAYYPLEHLAWLSSHRLLSISDEVTAKMSLWSCRFWFLWIVTYFIRLWETRKFLNIKENRTKNLVAQSEDDRIQKISALASNLFLSFALFFYCSIFGF
eukprot:Pompholyxophrys_punicea_v1_NODE_11_length_6810_cov_7.311029.p1 type:complete len:202 gc:universal NODE_11_length_6810_cov_7.311029:5238-5843(+)